MEPRDEGSPRTKKRRNAGLIREGAGPKCGMKSTSAGDSLVLGNVISAQSAYFISTISPARPIDLRKYTSRCRFSHDVSAYLNSKPKDIYFPAGSTLRNEPPFVSLPDEAEVTKEPSVDFTTRCPVFEATGTCRLGLKCRFLGGHVRKTEDGTVVLVENEEKKRLTLTANSELNFISPTALKLLRTKRVGPVSPTNF
jgi:Zinc finger C-x8-C-x5-C-x3-H type (and similar)